MSGKWRGRTEKFEGLGGYMVDQGFRNKARARRGHRTGQARVAAMIAL